MAPQAITVSANDRGDPDRFHNQDRQSPESLAQTVEELEAAVRSLEERVSSMNADLTYQIDTVERHGDQATRQLALEVMQMGEALSRRIRDQPAGAAPPAARPSTPISALTAALSGALVAALLALGLNLFHQPAAVTAPKPPAPAVPALYAPATPADVPAAAPIEPMRAPTHHTGAKPPVHHSVHSKAASSSPPSSPSTDTPSASASHSVSTPVSTPAPPESKAAASPP